MAHNVPAVVQHLRVRVLLDETLALALRQIADAAKGRVVQAWETLGALVAQVLEIGEAFVARVVVQALRTVLDIAATLAGDEGDAAGAFCTFMRTTTLFTVANVVRTWLAFRVAVFIGVSNHAAA